MACHTSRGPAPSILREKRLEIVPGRAIASACSAPRMAGEHVHGRSLSRFLIVRIRTAETFSFRVRANASRFSKVGAPSIEESLGARRALGSIELEGRHRYLLERGGPASDAFSPSARRTRSPTLLPLFRAERERPRAARQFLPSSMSSKHGQGARVSPRPREQALSVVVAFALRRKPADGCSPGDGRSLRLLSPPPARLRKGQRGLTPTLTPTRHPLSPFATSEHLEEVPLATVRISVPRMTRSRPSRGRAKRRRANARTRTDRPRLLAKGERGAASRMPSATRVRANRSGLVPTTLVAATRSATPL